MTEASLAAHRSNAQKSEGPATPQGQAQCAAASLRHGFYSRSRADVLTDLGEEPEEYDELKQSLLNDLQPREGLEKHLVLQMVEAFWRLTRAQRMQEGQALKRIHSKVTGEEMLAVLPAAKALENLQPFERMEKAMARPGGPTAEEVAAFVSSRKHDTSEESQELIELLQSLNRPLEQRQRKVVRREARRQLRQMAGGYEKVAWQMSRHANNIRSPENLAALMMPTSENGLLMQRMEDSTLRRLERLTHTLMRVRQGGLTPKDTKNEGGSGDVYENKGSHDKMTDKICDFVPENTEILEKEAAL
jgi:hypothetical protein